MLSAPLIDALFKFNEAKDSDLNKRIAELMVDQILPLKLDDGLRRDWLQIVLTNRRGLCRTAWFWGSHSKESWATNFWSITFDFLLRPTGMVVQRYAS